MAFQPHRLRRALRLSYSLFEHSLQGHKATLIPSISAPRLSPTPDAATTQLLRRPFTSTTALFRREFNPETDEIGPNTILFEGCDYNHWLITVDIPDDSSLTREQMIESYVNIAAKVFGSVEEAKKKIYALSTTTYKGFQVECSEDVSEKFKEIPEVIFVLPDSYMDPLNKEYGGDKYVNGEIFPRPPPVHFGRRNNRGPLREQNYGPSREQNYGPPREQNYGPPREQNYWPPREQNYGPPREQNYGPPRQQNYGPPSQQNNRLPPQQNYGQPPQQNYGQPLQQNYGQPPQQNYGQPLQQNYGQPPQQNYSPPSQLYSNRPPQQGFTPQPHQSYGPPAQQSYGPNAQGSYENSPNFPPHPNNSPAGPGGRSGYMPPNNTSAYDQRNSEPSYQGNFNRAEFETHSAQPGRGGFSQDVNYGSSQDEAFGQASGGHRNFSSSGNN